MLGGQRVPGALSHVLQLGLACSPWSSNCWARTLCVTPEQWCGCVAAGCDAQDEMLGKLKDLGNTILGKFGMSLDNFKATKDPNSGSYSISFQQ